MNNESANSFISALTKSLQALCQGYLEFNNGIEIIGHLYLNIDSESSFDYILRENVKKSSENSTTFVSKSFAAQMPTDSLPKSKSNKKISYGCHRHDDSSMSPSHIQSAITGLSSVYSGGEHRVRPHMDPSNLLKRKREQHFHEGIHSSTKYSTPESSSTTSSVCSNFFSGHTSEVQDKSYGATQIPGTVHSDFYASEVGNQEDADDLDLDVTFVKEEYSNRQHEAKPISLQQGNSECILGVFKIFFCLF